MESITYRTGLFLDLVFCIVFMPLLIALGPAQYWWVISPAFAILAILYLYGCYFATKALKLPQLILSKLYCRIAVISAILIALTYLLSLYPLPEVDFIIPSMSEYQTRIRNYNVRISLWFMFSVVLSYSMTVEFLKELYRRYLLQSIVENQRQKAELDLFKAQINPHFLFNTLNSIYSLIIGTSPKAEDAFVKFTELMKYTYTTAGKDWVTVGEEINHIRNYIDLQLIRLDGHTKVDWDCSADDEKVGIPPMIFLTFIENAFKYGISTSQDCNISIRLHISKGVLHFETQNRIMRNAEGLSKDMPVGINNCVNRLESLFPGRHTLKIIEEEGMFRVYLKIDLLKNERYNKVRRH